MPTTSEVIIKKATENDISLVLSFIKALAEYEQLSHEVVATQETLHNSLFGKNAVAEAIFAYYQEQPAGFAVFFHNFSTFLGRPGIYLEDIYVYPEFRNKKIGRTLLAYMARRAKKRKCGRLEWTALNWNQSAIQFYKNLGATPMQEWTTFRLTGEDLEQLAHNQKSP
ncbi:MAG: GNAT family N-acetyltransferase [SAR324 cluster bacterium]|nr:GNAT family N-acetyltransferase [SAR324 cluster bacterium]